MGPGLFHQSFADLPRKSPRPYQRAVIIGCSTRGQVCGGPTWCGTNNRRRRREQAAKSMTDTQKKLPAGEMGWAQARPVLDEAHGAKLTEADRDAGGRWFC